MLSNFWGSSSDCNSGSRPPSCLFSLINEVYLLSISILLSSTPLSLEMFSDMPSEREPYINLLLNSKYTVQVYL